MVRGNGKTIEAMSLWLLLTFVLARARTKVSSSHRLMASIVFPLPRTIVIGSFSNRLRRGQPRSAGPCSGTGA